MMCVVLFLTATLTVSAQIIKPEDLEKYAKERYGDSWLTAAANPVEADHVRQERVADLPADNRGSRQDEIPTVCHAELLGDGNLQGQACHHTGR